MKRRGAWAAGVLGAIAFAASCYGWDVWAQIFDPATSPNGWYVGDGAISVPLPTCVPTASAPCFSTNKRALWMFGDSILDKNSVSGQAYMVNNTIAVQERQDGEPPQESTGEITFWARRWLPKQAGGGSFELANVTTGLPSFTKASQQNMAGFMLNGDEQDPEPEGGETIYTWGASGVYIRTTARPTARPRCSTNRPSATARPNSSTPTTPRAVTRPTRRSNSWASAR